MKITTVVMNLLIAAVLCVGGLAGCSTPATRIEANPEVFRRLSPQHQTLVQAGQITLGFEPDAVKIALGDPDRVSVRTDADGETTMWHYLTYEYEGRVLFTGYYHTSRHWWGWGTAYPYYLDYPNRQVRDRFRVEFKRGKVVAITEDRAG